jgi:hypothetical protein
MLKVINGTEYEIKPNSDLSYSNLRYSNLSGSNLSYSNLRYSDLRYSDLSYSDLMGTIGNMREIKSLQIETWPVTYTVERLQIGCQNHSIKEWAGFSDETIKGMADGALEFWHKWKDVIFKIIELSPAIPTGYESKE